MKRHEVYAIATAILLASNAAIYYGWDILHGAGSHDVDVAFTVIAAIQLVLATATIQSAWRKQSSAIVMGAILALILGLMSLLLGLFLVGMDSHGKWGLG